MKLPLISLGAASPSARGWVARAERDAERHALEDAKEAVEQEIDRLQREDDKYDAAKEWDDDVRRYGRDER